MILSLGKSCVCLKRDWRSSNKKVLSEEIWFNNLCHSPKTHFKKTIKDNNSKEKPVDFKQYLIDEISKIFNLYEPLDIYNKILFELFNTEEDAEFFRDLGKLETSDIYIKLHNYQKLGVVNLIKILNDYNGALLADALGLGKTRTSLQSLTQLVEF